MRSKATNMSWPDFKSNAADSIVSSAYSQPTFFSQQWRHQHWFSGDQLLCVREDSTEMSETKVVKPLWANYIKLTASLNSQADASFFPS